MVGRGLVSLLGAAIVLGIAAPAALSDEGQRLIMVEHSPFMIEQLEKQGYDVGYVGEKYEAAVYMDDAQEAKLRADGYKIGETVADNTTWLARKAEIAATTEREALGKQLAQAGIPKSGVRGGKQIVTVPGEVVIMRAYTFTNYAGRFLYVEAHNKAHTNNSSPRAMTLSYSGGDGVFRPGITMSNTTSGPDVTNDPANGSKITDAGQYLYHRILRPLMGADANLTAAEMAVRVVSNTTATPVVQTGEDTSAVTEWAGEGMPPRVANFQKDFITKYMDPTEVYGRMDALTAQFPDLIEAIPLPNKTTGYQRQGMAVMAGTTTPTSNPNGTNAPFAVQLFSKAMGHLGGNDITAEFRNPSTATVPAPNSPLTVTVTDGTWRDYDPNDADASDGISEIAAPVKDIVVSLATNEAGAPTSTAAQVVAAINADPAASALVSAFTYANNAGAGIVPATPSRTYQVVTGTTNGPSFTSTKVRLGDGLRGGTVYWAGNFGLPDATPPVARTLVRTDARHVKKGPFDQKVYRIGKDRSNNAVGVFLYCQQHAREWVTGITCLETAERLVRNYATDPTTKEYVDKLNVFILPVVNPDGAHNSMHENSAQRKNMNNWCPITSTGGGIGNRSAWGVDLNRNNTIGTQFDGFSGADTSCTGETFTPVGLEATEAEIKNEHWIGDTFKGIKFANNIHTHGGYFMWAPGAYVSQGRVTLPAPNIGIERYFFDVADTILSHIKSSRNTVILPQRVGPIADVLYSAAGNSADENWYRRGIVAYSFEAGAQRMTVNPTTGVITRTNVGFQPCFAGPGTQGGQGSGCTMGNPPVANPLMVNEGHDSTMEFAEGNFGEIQGALEYHNDVTPPSTTIDYSAAQTSGDPINFKFNWVNEPSVIFYTTDGTAPTVITDNRATEGVEGCDNLPVGGSTRCYNGQGPRRPGEVVTLSTPGAYTVKWSSVDMKGNVEAVKTQRLLVAADDEPGTPGGTVPATLALSLGSAAAFPPFTPGVDQTYNASTTANVISTAGNATLSVSDPSSVNTGKLMNGTFTLAQPLNAAATSAAGTGSAFAPVGGSANPTSILSYAGPTSNDAVTLNFRQTIGRTEALRTGNYSKTLTFTLSTTQP